MSGQCNINTDCTFSFLNNSRVKPLNYFLKIAEVNNQILELLWKLGHRHVSISLWIRKTIYFLRQTHDKISLFVLQEQGKNKSCSNTDPALVYK